MCNFITMKTLPKVSNKKYGRLIIIRHLGVVGSHTMVEARCDCGVVKLIRLSRMICGVTRSCGCLAKELMSKRAKTHGLSKSHPLYGIWVNMKRRCSDKKADNYMNYGGNGVSVCNRWNRSFISFYNWAIQNGWKEGLQLDKDLKAPGKTGKLYCPRYCSFVTPKENCKGRKSTRFFTLNGITLSLVEWCEKLNINYHRVRARLYTGKWNFEKAILTP